MVARFDILVDRQDFSIFADVKRPAKRHLALGIDNPVSLGDFCAGIAQDRIVQLDGFGELRVFVRRIATGCEIGDIKFTDVVAARTERLAFRRSPTGEGLGKPGNHDRLFAFEIGKFIGLAVAARE